MWHGESFRPRYIGSSWKYVITFMGYNELFNLAVANQFLGDYVGLNATLWRSKSLQHATDICSNFRTMANEMVAGDLHLPVSKRFV